MPDAAPRVDPATSGYTPARSLRQKSETVSPRSHRQEAADAREVLQHRADAQATGAPGWLAVTLRDAGDLAGGIGLQRWLPDEDTSWLRPEHPEDAPTRDPHVLEVELAYVLGRPHRGRGYATEAGYAVLAYAFDELGVARVLSPINSVDGRSILLARRLGCRIRRNLHPRPSPYHDTPGVVAVLTRAEWAGAPDTAAPA